MYARHISRITAKEHGLNIIDIEDNQGLQDSILSLHHVLSLILEKFLVVKIIQNNLGASRLKVISR